MRKLAVVLLAQLALGAVAGELVGGVDRTDPNFVKASLIVVGPGDELFGCAGHASLRLECPQFKLDNCFSCESESVKGNFGRFVLGDMKMGMFAIPTADFLDIYSRGKRGVTQYPMNLPPDVKQRLWRIMDEKVKGGLCLHYDYIKHCCVQSVIQPILQAIEPYSIEFAPWPEQYKLSRREILSDNLVWCPWTRLFLHTIAGREVDKIVGPTRTVILSPDLLTLLRGAKINGKAIIEGEGEVLTSFPAPKPLKIFTPMQVALALLLLAIVNLKLRKRWIDWAFLGLQFAIGLLIVHLLLVSSLPATTWNWLIVPFNPLPLVFWRWRRYWARSYAAVLAGWEFFMLLYPHQLTDTAYLVLIPAYIVLFAKRIGESKK